MSVRWGVLFGCWLVAISAGMGWLWCYNLKPGSEGSVPAGWPSEAGPFTGEARLLVFAHPRCPCTRATIGQLAVALTRRPGILQATVFFYAPETESENWVRSDLWRQAAAVPGVTVRADASGEMAALFGARTSGHVMLYDAKGRLAFAGGITSGRGHYGDCLGLDALQAWADSGKSKIATVPVFGCSFESCRAPEASTLKLP